MVAAALCVVAGVQLLFFLSWYCPCSCIALSFMQSTIQFIKQYLQTIDTNKKENSSTMVVLHTAVHGPTVTNPVLPSVGATPAAGPRTRLSGPP